MHYRRQDNYVVLDFDGEINVQTVGQFKQYIFNTLERGEKNIILNFRNVTYINNIGISVLIEFYAAVLACKGDLKIIGINGRVKEIFDALDLKSSIPGLDYDKEVV